MVEEKSDTNTPSPKIAIESYFSHQLIGNKVPTNSNRIVVRRQHTIHNNINENNNRHKWKKNEPQKHLFCSSFLCAVVSFCIFTHTHKSTLFYYLSFISFTHLSVSFVPSHAHRSHIHSAFGFIITVIILYLVQTSLHLLSLSAQMMAVVFLLSYNTSIVSASCMCTIYIFLKFLCFFSALFTSNINIKFIFTEQTNAKTTTTTTKKSVEILLLL